MSTPAQQVTNPGRSENVAKQASLADAIAANLTAGREGKEPEPQRQVQPAPEPEVQPEPQERPEASEGEGDGLQALETEAQEAPIPSEDEDTSEPFTLADFADAAGVTPEVMLERLVLDVNGRDGTTRSTAKEIVEGYQWNAANHRKSEELAEQRRQIDKRLAEVNQAHEQANAMLELQWADLNAEEQAIEQQYRSVNWADLQTRQDGSYADAEAQFQRARTDIQRRRDRLQNAYGQMQQQRQAAQEQYMRETLPAERERLLDAIPAWRGNDTKEAADWQGMATFAKDRYGLEPQEVMAVTDHRLIRLLHDFWSLQQQASGAGTTAKKVKEAPKVLRPGQQAARESTAKKRRDQLKRNLRRTGKRQDLQALILNDLRQ